MTYLVMPFVSFHFCPASTIGLLQSSAHFPHHFFEICLYSITVNWFNRSSPVSRKFCLFICLISTVGHVSLQDVYSVTRKLQSLKIKGLLKQQIALTIAFKPLVNRLARLPSRNVFRAFIAMNDCGSYIFYPGNTT